MRGFGDTDKPEGVENYKLDLLVEDLRLFIEALGNLLIIGNLLLIGPILDHRLKEKILKP